RPRPSPRSTPPPPPRAPAPPPAPLAPIASSPPPTPHPSPPSLHDPLPTPPIAPAGSLAGGQTVPMTITAEDANNNPLPGAIIYLSLDAATAPANPASIQAAAHCTGLCGANLNATPQQCVTDSHGQLPFDHP